GACAGQASMDPLDELEEDPPLGMGNLIDVVVRDRQVRATEDRHGGLEDMRGPDHPADFSIWGEVRGALLKMALKELTSVLAQELVRNIGGCQGVARGVRELHDERRVEAIGVV